MSALEREALPAGDLPHLLLRFESNDSHRHRWVAPSFLTSAGSLTISPTQDARAALRRTLRSRRRDIPRAMRTTAARRVARLVAKSGWLKPGRHIGLYLSMPEELDTAPLLALARRRGCTISLPRVVAKRQGRMRFYDLTGGVRRGAFGILEPAGMKFRPVRSLDVVFVPLVGFDRQGNRMGMGRGFYDICFAHRRLLRHWRRPLLVGVAYEAQCVPTLPLSSHDVPMDAIVTESSLRRIRRTMPGTIPS
jgi:5-formyltetrahydrofolate cyclo-ligase